MKEEKGLTIAQEQAVALTEKLENRLPIIVKFENVFFWKEALAKSGRALVAKPIIMDETALLFSDGIKAIQEIMALRLKNMLSRAYGEESANIGKAVNAHIDLMSSGPKEWRLHLNQVYELQKKQRFLFQDMQKMFEEI